MDDEDKPVLIKKGAEAGLYLLSWHGRKAVAKKRLPKKYRPSILDLQIRTYRTAHEPQLIHCAKEAGVPTPTIFQISLKDTTLVMSFVEGKLVKQLLNEVPGSARIRLCRRIGESVGKLHGSGIIHGDLTTSNMIHSTDGKIFFIDFGLGEKSKELEARGVDLHLLKRALQSAHFRFADQCFSAVVEGYSAILGRKSAKSVLDKVREIEMRGRYVADRRS